MTTLLTGSSVRSRRALDDDVDLVRDRLLVTRAQAGDRSAFDDLYLRYFRRLYRFCLRRLHDPHEAEDVAQEAFARAWRSLPNFGGDRRFYPWLSVIAANLCTDVTRRRSRSTPVAEFHQGNVASTEDGGEELMIAAADSAMAAEAFSRLSERHQRILSLREGSGWSYQRIADHEGVGVTAVETLLWRARQALKREFAAVSGHEGPMAAFAGGGLFSLSALRRLLAAPARTARRLTHAGPALALGSAAAATAFVIAMGTGGLAGEPGPPGAVAPGSTGLGHLRTAGGAAPASGPAPATPTTPGPSDPGASAVTAAPGTAGSASPLAGAGVAAVGSTTGNAVKGLGDLLRSMLRGAGGSSLVGSLGDAVANTTTAAGDAVTGVSGAVANTAQSLTAGLGSPGAAPGAVLGTGQGVVSGTTGVVGTAAHGLAGVVGAITATTTTLSR
jgi:RNA polymerase sigma-70 factor (ECF subfamily)